MAVNKYVCIDMFKMQVLGSQVFIFVFQFTTGPSAEVKNCGAMPPLPVCLHGIVID
jgi:hypothetical protein